VDSLGEFLKREREERNITLEVLAKYTKYHVSKLKALEEDKHDDLPSPPYVKGMLSSIGRYLGLNVTDLLLKYDEMLRERGAQTPTQHIGLPKIPYYKKKHFLTIFTTAVFLVLAVAVFIIFRGTEEVEPLGDISVGEGTIIEDMPGAAEEGTGPYSLWIEASKDIWIKLQKDSDEPISFYLHPGQKRQFEARKVVRFFVNEAEGVKVLFNNKAIEATLSGPQTFVFPEKFEAVKEDGSPETEKKPTRRFWPIRKKEPKKTEKTSPPRVRP